MVQNLRLFRNRKGVSQQSVNKYENHGVEPDLQTLIRLADYFETSVDALIGYDAVPRAAYELTAEEAHLVDSYRQLNDTEKEIVRLLLQNHNA